MKKNTVALLLLLLFWGYLFLQFIFAARSYVPQAHWCNHARCRDGIAQQFDGTLVGWPNCKIKGEDSLRGKMCNEIKLLLKQYENRPSYTPGVDELVRSVHDCLRYTLVFSRETYTAAVKELERQLLASVKGKPSAKRIKFKNFWRENDGETCYQGINAQVTLNTVDDIATNNDRVDTTTPNQPDCLRGEPIPNSNNFVFELQLHTKESFALKDGPGHLLYEALRDPDRTSGTVLGKEYFDKNEYKRAIYKASKGLLMSVHHETGEKLQIGEVVLPGLKAVDPHTHKELEEDYKYTPFKPDPPIAFYQSTVDTARAKWCNELHVNKTFEQEITGLPYPHGYRTA